MRGRSAKFLRRAAVFLKMPYRKLKRDWVDSPAPVRAHFRAHVEKMMAAAGQRVNSLIR